MTPCTELLAIEAIEEMMAPPLILLSLQESVQIEAGRPDLDTDSEPDDDDNDY